MNVNECLKSPCRTNSECKDTYGSYECPCITGFYESGSFCYNTNECGDGTHTCPENSACIDTNGSYDCRCSIGYSGESCLNIDECAAKTHTCRNWLKSNPTYILKKYIFSIRKSHICNDNDGSYTCECNSGYVLSQNRYCNNINECTSGTHNCQIKCIGNI